MAHIIMSASMTIRSSVRLAPAFNSLSSEVESKLMSTSRYFEDNLRCRDIERSFFVRFIMVQWDIEDEKCRI